MTRSQPCRQPTPLRTVQQLDNVLLLCRRLHWPSIQYPQIIVDSTTSTDKHSWSRACQVRSRSAPGKPIPYFPPPLPKEFGAGQNMAPLGLFIRAEKVRDCQGKLSNQVARTSMSPGTVFSCDTASFWRGDGQVSLFCGVSYQHAALATLTEQGFTGSRAMSHPSACSVSLCLLAWAIIMEGDQ